MDEASKNLRYELKEDYFTCPICCENWLHRDPRVLPCQHTFCKECLNQLQLKNKAIDFLCPICRSAFYWPIEGADGLIRNRIAWNVLSVSKEKDNVEDLSNVTSVCVEHKAEVLFFCRQCWNVPVCKECWNDHKDHDLKPWLDYLGNGSFLIKCNTVMEDLKQRMEISMDSLNNGVVEIERKIPELRKRVKIIGEDLFKKEEARIESLYKKYSILVSKFEKISNTLEIRDQSIYDQTLINLIQSNICLIVIILIFFLVVYIFG
ncbi:unnamed protein product [Dimorphilus gyrociliatus]|uniref:RING-type domain-containing protein n=1 Tax=Dimorphilus gyrociliatus TaxID=2664684 RepID=A0A7I8W9S3_9ANNE|nr:unnamed protein product [Dimorphilus gyrociliatus]